VGANDREDQPHRFLSDEITQNRTMARITPTIFLAVGRLSTPSSRGSVQLQRSQVGLKAFGYLGARSRCTTSLALVISLIGAALGVANGRLFAATCSTSHAEFYFFPMYGTTRAWRWPTRAVAAALGAVPAACGAASRFAPAETMRAEPLPRFHAG
jgi:hypothetical protein